MANTLELGLRVRTEASDRDSVRQISEAFKALGVEAGAVAPVAKALSKELAGLLNQQALINQFRALKAEVQAADAALIQSRENTRASALVYKQAGENVEAASNALKNAKAGLNALQGKAGIGLATTEDVAAIKAAKTEISLLGKELKAAEKEASSAEKGLERARKSTSELADQAQKSHLSLQNLRKEMQAAGVSSANLAESQIRVSKGIEDVRSRATTYAQSLQSATTETAALGATSESASVTTGLLGEAQAGTAAQARSLASAEASAATATQAAANSERALATVLSDIESKEQALARQLAVVNDLFLSGRLTVDQYHQAVGVYTTKASGAISTTGRLSEALGKSVAAFLAFESARRAVVSLGQVESRFDRINAVLKIASGSIQTAAEDLEFIRGKAEDLGLPLAATALEFSKFNIAIKGTELEGEKGRVVFTALASAFSKTGAPAEELARGFKALTDIISKGNVQSEDLKGQLGEVLPGALQIAARAVGLTTSELIKLLDKGGQLSTELALKLAPELDRTFGTGRTTTFAANINRLSNAWEEFKLVLAETTPIKGVVSTLADLVGSERDFVTALGGVGGKSKDELESAHDAIVRLLSQVKEGSLDWEFFQSRLRAVNAELAKFGAEAQTKPAFSAALPGLISDADKIVKQFDALTKAGKDTAEALKEIGKGLKPGDVGSIRAYGQALEDLRLAGKATSAELRTAFEQTAKGLSAEGLRQFAANLEEAFSGQGLRDVQALNELLDVTLRESIQRFGLDAEQALSGIGKPVSDAIASLQTIQSTLEATGASAEDTGRILSLAIEQAIPKADTVAELDALSASIEEMGSTGALSTTQLAEANAELAIQLREVEAQEVRNNAVLQEAVRAQSEAVQAAQREATATERASNAKVEKARLAYESAQATGTESQQTQAHIALLQAEAEQADIVAAGKARIAEAAASKVAAITAEAEADGTLTEAEQEIIDKAEEVAAAKQAEADAAKTSADSKDVEVAAAKKEADAKKDNAETTKDATKANKDLSSSQETVTSTTLVSTKALVAVNKALSGLRTGLGTSAEAWLELAATQKIAANAAAQLAQSQALASILSAAVSSGQNLTEALRAAGGSIDGLRAKFKLLDESQLSGLESSLSAIQSKLEQLRESSESALQAQIREANTLAGNEAGNQVLDDQNSRRDLAAQLAEAQAAGDGESVKNLKQAQTLLESNIKTRRAAEEENIKKLEEASDVAAKSGNKSLQEFYNYSLALTSAGNTLADAITAATDAANNSLKEETASFQATIAAIQASVADFGAGIDDSIRELRRGTLSDADAEADKLNEINEKLAKAKELARAGNTEGAKALRDEIVSLGKSIAKSGDQESTDKAIAVLEQAKALNEDIGSAEEKAAEALHATKVAYIESEKKASIAAAQDSYDAQIAAANAAHEAIMAQIAAENAARAAGYSGVFSIGRGAFQLQTGGGGSYSGPTGPGQTSNPADVQREGKTGNPLPSTGFAFGGPVFSGHLPGYGGGDRRHIIAEDGEFVQRKEAVRHYGIPMMDAINKMRLPKFALGGPIGLPVQKMARGGTVSAPEMIIELRGPGSTASAGRFPRRSATDELLSELGKSNAVRAGR